jgi:hypothetical protein
MSDQSGRKSTPDNNNQNRKPSQPTTYWERAKGIIQAAVDFLKRMVGRQ